jgi:hypothetical protein
VSEERDNATGPPRSPDEARGAAPEVLRRWLGSAPAAVLSAALDNPSLGTKEIVLVLRNRATPASALARVGRDRAWTVNREIRKLLVQHPNSPHTLSMGLLPDLFWKDLADVTRTPGAHPAVRRKAEDLLRTRLERMSSGEKTTLSRLATRGLIKDLIDTDDGGVLRGLLGNSRLVEVEAVRIASARRSRGAVLEFLARFSHWKARPAVRTALLRNRNTPLAAALSLLRGLERPELQRVARDPAVQPAVRVRAERLLQRAGAGTHAGGPRRPDDG